MKCTLCGEEIESNLSGWSQGNNGQPLVDGRVCDLCDGKVIQERLRLAIVERSKEVEDEKNL